MPLKEWGTIFAPTDRDGAVLLPEELPLATAVLQRRPAHERISITGLDGARRDLSVTAFPLVGLNDRDLGAVAIFWEDSHS